jgi:hypothetical protein
MEEPLAGDDDGQPQADVELAGNGDADEKTAASSPETVNDGFDADVFASMMQQELIAYNVSWDPLMKVLQALGASMAKQQRTQENSNATVKKMEDQVAALRDELVRADEDKKQAAAAMEAMQNQVGEMQNQLEEIQGLAPLEDQEQQHESSASDEVKAPTEGVDGESDAPSVAKQPSPRSPRASSVGRPSFATAKDLADLKKELGKEMKRALSRAFGHDVIEEEDEDDGSSHEEGGAEDLSTNGNPADRSRDGFQLPGAPFASATALQQGIEKLQGLQEALSGRVAEHDQLLDALNGRVGKLDDTSSQLPGLDNGSSTMPAPTAWADGENGNNGSGAESSSQSGRNGNHVDFAEATSDILKELKELKALQDEHDQKIREHDEVVEKHTVEIKALTDSLDDISVQQQTVASMYSTGGTAGDAAGEGSGKETTIPTDDSGKASKSEKQGGRAVDAISQPQLDLSLVFTKLADLRRSTDASLSSLQQSIKGVSGTTQSQQEQLDALRNNVVFNEHLQAHLVESRLAMQKELLARNQTFQDRTKPQLVEWRKALELTEDKLLQGNSDNEILHALQQMQRCYHRTLLSIAPLVNSPLTIAETLQTLSDEVKQLQNAVRLGVVPLRVADFNDGDSGDGGSNKDEREDEYARKLRYLDEEIDATLQVNITTEKKNDPLIKGLDAMREKVGFGFVGHEVLARPEC